MVIASARIGILKSFRRWKGHIVVVRYTVCGTVVRIDTLFSVWIPVVHRIIHRIRIPIEIPRPHVGEPGRIGRQESRRHRVVIPRLGVGQARGGVADVAGEPSLVTVGGGVFDRFTDFAAGARQRRI
jgi:hypothetical protein